MEGSKCGCKLNVAVVDFVEDGVDAEKKLFNK